MRRNFLRIASSIALIALGAVSGCGGGGGGTNENVIKIGSLQSLTGDTSTFGTSSNKGIILATEQRNKSGGVMGKQIEIVPADFVPGQAYTASVQKTAPAQIAWQ